MEDVVKPWRWQRGSAAIGLERVELVDGQGRIRATVWPQRDGSATWHTWDASGTGGENWTTTSVDQAKRDAVSSIVLQGWAPGGWRVEWSPPAPGGPR